jgi:probable F420-dependent oxidoreductase
MVVFGIEPIAEDPQQIMKLAELAENYNYDFVWIPESQLIWRELFCCMSLCAQRTTKVKVGSGVANVLTRHPTVLASAISTVNEISNGRAVLGLGRGDSAVRLMGKRPATVENFISTARMIRSLCNGEEIDYSGTKIKITWAAGKIPIYIAAYGPRMLEFAGQFADGVIIQIGEPNIVKWSLNFIRKGVESAGRDIREIDIVAFTTAYVSEDLAKARKMVRWYPATVSNHVFDLLSRYPTSDLPPQLLTDMDYMRGKYDYWEHDVVDSKHSKNVTDRLVDSFTICGNPENCVRRINELEKIGVTNINLYLPTGESEYTARSFAEQVMPSFRA